MYRQLLVHNVMESEAEKLTIAKDEMEARLKTLPSGSISLKRGKSYHSYREGPGGKQHMVAITDSKLLNDLKVRRKMKKSIAVLEAQIERYNTFLEGDNIYDPVKLELELPEHYRGGRCPHLWLPGDVDPEEWAAASYVSNPAKIENPSETNGGRIVRSKSEAIIGSVAEDVPLIHRYEQRIEINGEVFYPDFIFLMPLTRKLIYYEHFGKMDDLEYVKKTTHKLEVYPHYGLYLGYNFFASFETRNSSFSYPGAKEIINRMLEYDKIWYYGGSLYQYL